MEVNSKLQYEQLFQEQFFTMLDQYDNINQDLTSGNYSTARKKSSENRFWNILPPEEGLIDISLGFINANYILNKKYISTQYPLEHTINQFWCLILETDTKFVVNLTKNCNYLKFPTVYKININSYMTNDVFSLKEITISNDTKTKLIHHITFKKWDDHKVPNPKDFENLLSNIDLFEPFWRNGSILIHCMAGVGRTGTLILAHYILNNINEDVFEHPLVILKQMRKMRCGMVQTKQQFKFVLKFIKSKILPTDERKRLISSCGAQISHNNLLLSKTTSKLTISCDAIFSNFN